MTKDSPCLMDGASQVEKDVDLQRRDLAHRLGGEEDLILGDHIRATALGGVQVDLFDQFHVVQQRGKCDEIREAHFVTLSYLVRLKILSLEG